ncbi:MAG: transposase [Candidatus Riflebacteria bacterium]|nr:transposase [Candidatus Riflebacteria bacterium]
MKKMPKQQYTKEFREQAASLVVRDGMSVAAAAKQLGMSARTIDNWVRKGDLSTVGSTRRPVTDLEAEVARLHRELAVSRMECDLLKNSSSILCSGIAARYALIKSMLSRYSVSAMCRFSEVSISGYYSWEKRVPSKREIENNRLEVAIAAAHKRIRGTYGAERLKSELLYDGFRAALGVSNDSEKSWALQATSKIQGYHKFESLFSCLGQSVRVIVLKIAVLLGILMILKLNPTRRLSSKWPSHSRSAPLFFDIFMISKIPGSTERSVIFFPTLSP